MVPKYVVVIFQISWIFLFEEIDKPVEKKASSGMKSTGYTKDSKKTDTAQIDKRMNKLGKDYKMSNEPNKLDTHG